MSADAVPVAEAVERLGLPAQSVIDLAMVGKLVTAPSGSSSHSGLELTRESVERYEQRLDLIRNDTAGVVAPSWAGGRPRCRGHVAWVTDDATVTEEAHGVAQASGWS